MIFRSTGTKWDYNSDWSALFDAAGIATNLDWDGRFLAWINLKLSASYTNLPGAMAALAVNQGALDWSGLGTFSATLGVLHLSAATIPSTATVGTNVGTLSVTGGSGSYTYTFTSNPGGLFAIATAALNVGAALTQGSDAITIQANNGAGSIITQPFLITVTGTSTGQSMGLLLALTYP